MSCSGKWEGRPANLRRIHLGQALLKCHRQDLVNGERLLVNESGHSAGQIFGIPGQKVGAPFNYIYHSLQAREEHLRPYKEGSKKWQDKELFNMTIPDAFLDEHLKKDLILYGEAAQATYDTVDLQQWSRFRDKSR